MRDAALHFGPSPASILTPRTLTASGPTDMTGEPALGAPLSETFDTPFGTAQIVPQAAMLDPQNWHDAFDGCTKDARYYQICETALPQANFDYRYLLLRDKTGRVRALQPLFFHRPGFARWPERRAARAGGRRPAALSPVYEHEDAHGRLHRGRGSSRPHHVRRTRTRKPSPRLLEALEIYGRKHKAAIITFKDFTKDHRPTLTPPATATRVRADAQFPGDDHFPRWLHGLRRLPRPPPEQGDAQEPAPQVPSRGRRGRR